MHEVKSSLQHMVSGDASSAAAGLQDGLKAFGYSENQIMKGLISAFIKIK